MIAKSVAFFITILVLVGCKDMPCININITPVFVGFSKNDIDTIIIRKFKKSDNFSNLYDTALVTSNLSFFKTSKDTTAIEFYYSEEFNKLLLPDNDWQIYIPAKNVTISLSNINSPQTEISCFNCSCTNPIISFIQNGQLKYPQSEYKGVVSGSYCVAYIHN